MTKILSIIAPQGFQEIEYGDPKKVLEDHGHVVTTASTVKNPTGHLGHSIPADLLLDEVNVDEYDAVYFVGGGGSVYYFDHPQALKIAKEFYEKGKLTCAICAAPSILANAGLLNGKTATCFWDQAENLKAKGANYTGNPVEQDGKIITANGPAAAKEFGETISKALE